MLNMELPPLGDYQYADCLHAIDLSVVYNFGHSYERIFASYWGFQYSPQPGTKIEDWVNRDGLANTADYGMPAMTGIRCTDCNAADRQELFRIIRSCNGTDRIIVFKMNLFHLPGQQGYTKINVDHYLIALGMTEEGQIYCHDPYHYHEKIILEPEVTKHISLEYKVYSQDHQSYRNEITNHEIVLQAARYFSNRCEHDGNDLSRFAADLTKNEMMSQLREITSPMVSVFFFKYNCFVMDRINILFFMKQVLDLPEESNEEKEIIAIAYSCMQKWRSTFLLLSKALSRSANLEMVQQTSVLLEELAAEELQLANNIQYLAK